MNIGTAIAFAACICSSAALQLGGLSQFASLFFASAWVIYALGGWKPHPLVTVTNQVSPEVKGEA